MKARQVGWSILFFLLSMLLLTGCGGSSGNDASDDVSDDDDDNDDNDDNDNDDNDDNDDDTTDDFPIQLVDGGAPGHNGVSMVRSADGT
ncbi:MAG: hypothetical protein GX444_00425, partial [Myxococcales bacterium]|nr:hypothetical protein [Myxococcales bacterium]